MKMTSFFVLIVKDQDIYFCSDEHEKVKLCCLKGEGIDQILQ